MKKCHTLNRFERPTQALPIVQEEVRILEEWMRFNQNEFSLINSLNQ